MTPLAALAPPDFLEALLLRFLGPEAVRYVVWPFVQIGLVVTLVAFWALYASYLERKISAFMQARLGPMRVGKWGLLQPIADAVKLLTKEDLRPDASDPHVFRIAPYVVVAAAFLTFAVVPFAPDWGVITDVNIGLLFVLAISSVGVLGLILAGWASNSKYALLGGLRSSAQMVSYEVSMGLSLVGALLFARTLSLSGVVQAQASDSVWFFLYQPLGFFVFFISGIAENNRAPFDLPEAESELVAGFHTEYSGMRWSLFFMAEYAAMVVVSAVAVTVYFGGWYLPGLHSLTGGYNTALYAFLSLGVFVAKMALLLYVYFWVRWTFPRYRYDQLMDLGWKWLIPASLINVVWTALSVFAVQALDGWRGLDTVEGLGRGLDLTGAGKGLMVALGLLGVLVAWLSLAGINRRARDFNLKKQRRQVRLVEVPKGAPAAAAAAAGEQ